jgi:biotin carboxyl carrier protein
MKLQVKIDDQTYEVEIGDLTTRPIRATVDGETFDIWPEETASLPTAPRAPAATTPAAKPTAAASATAGKPAVAPAATASANAVCAPIPGVIISIAVQPGATVRRGQELCLLEAMKMNNAIRSPRDGQIASVPVSVGQAVKHGDVLVTFEP